jgi:uncharacterized protein (DUF305 family)
LSAAVATLTALTLAPGALASGPRSAAERDFLMDMVGHHTMAVDMAEMAREKATHQELKDVADQIIRSQSAEIERMRRWLRDWYDEGGEPHMGHEDEAQMRMLEEATGPEFEVRFLALMSVHHTQAVERATAIRRRPIHRATRKLTREIMRAQMREIEQFQEWLVTWYAN